MSDTHAPRAERPFATTTDAGIAAASDEQSQTAGPSGPTRLQQADAC
jgi:catalase